MSFRRPQCAFCGKPVPRRQSVCVACGKEYPPPYEPNTWQHFLIRDELNERRRAERCSVVELPFAEDMPDGAPDVLPKGVAAAYEACKWMGVEYE